jgi:hypothetical protein
MAPLLKLLTHWDTLHLHGLLSMAMRLLFDSWWRGVHSFNLALCMEERPRYLRLPIATIMVCNFYLITAVESTFVIDMETRHYHLLRKLVSSLPFDYS